MLAPMCLAERSRAWRFAATTTIMSLLGGIAGYGIGFFLIDAIEPWLQSGGSYDAYLKVRDWFAVWGVLAVFIAGFSPVPYKIFTIAAGATVLNFPGFVFASLIGRGARFFLVAGIIVFGGDRMADGLQRHVERIGWAVVGLAIVLAAYLVWRQ
jgi:membrane protein YqaA with SNARE-associated domain